MVLLTSVDFPESFLEIEKAGFSAYLTKPITSSNLLESLLQAWNAFSNQTKSMITQYSKDIKIKDISTEVNEVSFSEKKGKILIVDDFDLNVIVLKSILKNLNLNSDIASSGKEAIEMCNMTHYNIIFMDIEMPDLNGVKTFSAIKKIENYQKGEVTCIATTAHAIKGSKEKFLNQGFTDYLSKPALIKKLKELLSIYLK
jgi:CheY-like chemotaxis protein